MGLFKKEEEIFDYTKQLEGESLKEFKEICKVIDKVITNEDRCKLVKAFYNYKIGIRVLKEKINNHQADFNQMNVDLPALSKKIDNMAPSAERNTYIDIFNTKRKTRINCKKVIDVELEILDSLLKQFKTISVTDDEINAVENAPKKKRFSFKF